MMQFEKSHTFLMTVVGSGLCGATAGLLTMLFRNGAVKAAVPWLFLVIIAVVASIFGVAAGIAGSFFAAFVFATFLFAPTGSVLVQDMNQRSAVVWMLVVGVAVSYFVGRSIDNGRNRKMSGE